MIVVLFVVKGKKRFKPKEPTESLKGVVMMNHVSRCEIEAQTYHTPINSMSTSIPKNLLKSPARFHPTSDVRVYASHAYGI